MYTTNEEDQREARDCRLGSLLPKATNPRRRHRREVLVCQMYPLMKGRISMFGLFLFRILFCTIFYHFIFSLKTLLFSIFCRYVLISAIIPDGGERQNFVVSRLGAHYHRDAAEPFVEVRTVSSEKRGTFVLNSLS